MISAQTARPFTSLPQSILCTYPTAPGGNRTSYFSSSPCACPEAFSSTCIVQFPALAPSLSDPGKENRKYDLSAYWLQPAPGAPPGERKMHPCHYRMQRNSLVVLGKRCVLQQFFRKPHRISKAFQGCIFGIHQFTTVLHKVRIRHTLMCQLLPKPLDLLHSILSMQHSGLKSLVHICCFLHHIAELNHLLLRSKLVSPLIARNQCSVREPSLVVIFDQVERLCIVRKEVNSLHLFFICGIRSAICSTQAIISGFKLSLKLR